MSRTSVRTLGRTLLARQHLLARTERSVNEVLTHLVGLQAQVPRDPYLALWSRVAGFVPAHLEARYLDRSVARIVAIRGTIHLLTADDVVGLRNLFQPVLDQEMRRHSEYKAALGGLDLAPVTGFGEKVLATPHSVAQMKTALAERFPQHDAGALALACRNTVPLVQVPPRGLWSRTAQVTYVTASEWLGRPVDPRPSLEEALRRYLAAFGPATVADMTTWSRLTGLREVVEGMRPTLRTWTDEDGRELFDVPDGVLVDPDTPAPVRFLPEYDNVLLSHADRRRVIPADHPGLRSDDELGVGSVLVDGSMQATWRVDRTKRRSPTVTIRHRAGLAKRRQASVLAEAHRALPILAHDADEADVVVLISAP
ncbi:MAG: winged helix DNA-binding domain-containing protein [Acidimicrobiales bacterium]